MASPAQTQNRPNAGKPLSQLKSVEDLTRKIESLKTARSSLERQWRLNLAFYNGKQYAYYVPGTSRLESLVTDDGLMPRHRIRIVSNQIMPGAHTLLAQLTKTKPRIYATPGANGQSDVRAAQMASALMDHWWREMALDEKLDEALLWSIIASAGYWKITWDPFAAKQMRFLLGPDGQPITDENLKTAFRTELAKSGVQPKEKIVYMGDIKIDVMSPFDVFADNTAKIWDEQKFVFCRHALDPDEIRSRWGVDVQPDAAPSQYDVGLPFQKSGTGGGTDLIVRNVFIGYFKPSASMPDGRYVVFTEGSDRQILADEKWPYPHNNLPVIKFAGMRVPGNVYDDAVVTHAIPIQKELNRTISQIVEYKNMTVNPAMIAPIGSLQTRRTTEPGQILTYAQVGNGNNKPEWQDVPAMPPYVFEILKDISGRLQEIFLSAEVLQGKVPPNVEAGIAIDLLQEMATDKLAPIIKLMEVSLARAGQQMLSLAQKYYSEPRKMKIKGSGASVQVRSFDNSDINGDISVHTETASGLPRTRAGKQARIERMVELQLLSPRQAMKELEIGDLNGVMMMLEADEGLAYRNIDKLIAGTPLNPEAEQKAEQAVQQGVNPQTQMQFQSPQEAMDYLQKSALMPQPGIDFDTHMDVTSLFMKGVEFENLQPEVRQAFFTYWGNLLEAKLSIAPIPQPQAPRTALQIKATAGPTAVSKILGRAGVQVTPDEMAEPPLETWVSDSVDKPDTDAAGPGQEANNLSQAAATVLEAAAADAESKRQATQKNQEHTVDLAQKIELHGHAVRKAAAEAALAEKKAQQSDFKPKPAAKKAA